MGNNQQEGHSIVMLFSERSCPNGTYSWFWGVEDSEGVHCLFSKAISTIKILRLGTVLTHVAMQNNPRSGVCKTLQN